MAFRTPLRHLLRSLLPPHDQPRAAARPDFADTRPDDGAGSTRHAAADKIPPSHRRPSTTWAESSIELAQGTEIMEFPDDTAADLMDEYFAEPKKRAA
jgi:hypothetical protein